MKRLVFAAMAGAIFGAGLVISGMSNPNKVLNFLDIIGPWDASLVVVMAVAVTITFVGFRVVWKREKPICDSAFMNPSNRTIDKDLVLGAALFGVGWGLAGYCPGPAITALVIAPKEAGVFVIAMLAGGMAFSAMRKTAR